MLSQMFGTRILQKYVFYNKIKKFTQKINYAVISTRHKKKNKLRKINIKKKKLDLGIYE